MPTTTEAVKAKVLKHLCSFPLGCSCNYTLRFKDGGVFSTTPSFSSGQGFTPASFVAAKNVHRRNLTTNERALIAAKMAALVHGSNQFGRRPREEGVSAPSSTVSINEAADLMGVARGTVVSAKTIIDHGSEVDIAAQMVNFTHGSGNWVSTKDVVTSLTVSLSQAAH